MAKTSGARQKARPPVGTLDEQVRWVLGRRGEFPKRTAFALLWSLALHDRGARDEQFLGGLALIEGAANDDRNFVKKAVSMALRAIGKRNRSLGAAAVETATRLAASAQPSARWIGKDALRELRQIDR